MALTEQQRSEIYGNLAKAIGEQGAEFLMAQQPPGGWEQLATKQDLAALDVKTQASFVEVHAKIGETNAEMVRGFAAVDKQFANADRQFAKLSESRGRDFYAIIFAIIVMGVAICGVVLAA